MNWYKNGAILLFIILVLGIVGSFFYKVEGFQSYNDYYAKLVNQSNSGYTGGYTGGGYTGGGYTGGGGGYRDTNTDDYNIIYYAPNGYKVQIINANNTYGLVLTTTDGKVITYNTNDYSSYGKPLVYMVPKTFYGSDSSYAVVDRQNDIYTITIKSSDGTTTVYTKEGQVQQANLTSSTQVITTKVDNTPASVSMPNMILSGSDGSTATFAQGQFILTTVNGQIIIYNGTSTLSGGTFYGPNGSIATMNPPNASSGNNMVTLTTPGGATVQYTLNQPTSNTAYTATTQNQQQNQLPPDSNYIQTPYDQPPQITPEQYGQNTLKQENLYILKTKLVPMVCPSCQMITTNKSGTGQCKKCQISTESKYGYDSDSNLPSPNPVLNDYSTYGT